MSLIANLNYNYDDFKISIPQWEIQDQGITVLWGASGSGKTTLLRILIGLEAAPSFQWEMQTEQGPINLASLKVPERRLGVVFQTLDLFPHMTARENIIFAGESRKIAFDEIKRKIKSYSEILHMDSFLDREAQKLSGGEKQRTALSRALIGRPRMLLLDEPFSALDESLKNESRQLLKKIVLEEKIPVLMVTHDQRDVDVLANEVFILENGSLVKK